jgi:hypothetical protein
MRAALDILGTCLLGFAIGAGGLIYVYAIADGFILLTHLH